jgi:cell division protease FtsH
MIYGGDRVTTGASNDIERATELARNMVTRWGFSDKLGPLVYGEEGGQAFMGYPGSKGSAVSTNVAHLIDDEIREVIDRNYQRAETLLQDNIKVLHKMADALMKWETIDRLQIEDLMAGREPRTPVDDSVVLEIKPDEPSNNEPQDKLDSNVTQLKSAKKKAANQV